VPGWGVLFVNELLFIMPKSERGKYTSTDTKVRGSAVGVGIQPAWQRLLV
jgi:hypothetical protein